MKYADAKNESALMTNATLRPASAVTTPPIDAPRASMADHVALDKALAGISSRSEVMFGIVAVRAGSKNDVAETVSAITDVRDPHLIATPDEQQAEDQHAAQEVGGDHQPPPVDAVDDHTGHRADDRDRQKLHDQHPGDHRRRTGQIEDQREDRDGVEPVAELRDRLADVEETEISVLPEECEIGIHARL